MKFDFEQHRRRTPRAGFSLVEMLFAIMILGIGFIMIAGMFPVAIRQNQSNYEQTFGSTVGQTAVGVLDGAVDGAVLPPTRSDYSASNPLTGAGKPAPMLFVRDIASTGPTLWAALRGNLIMPSDTRIAWTPLYSRRTGENWAQVTVFATTIRNRSTYDDGTNLPYKDLVRGTAAADSGTTGTPTTLEPQLITGVQINQGSNGSPDTITFPADNSGTGAASAVGEGCYVVVSQDSTHSDYCDGWIFKVGSATGTAGQWQLQPGGNLGTSTDPGPYGGSAVTSISCSVYVIGRGRTDPTSATPYTGPAQDVAVYTGYLRLR